MRKAKRVKFDEDRAISGMEIENAVDWFGFQQPQERHDLSMSRERYFLAKMHKQSLVTRGLKAWFWLSGTAHRREIIPQCTLAISGELHVPNAPGFFELHLHHAQALRRHCRAGLRAIAQFV